MKNFLILALLFICASCTKTTQFASYPKGEALEKTKDLADIYIIRNSFYGSAVPIDIFDGGELIGRLGNKGYLHWQVPAGDTLHLKSDFRNPSYLVLPTQAGETYYIHQRLKSGLLKVRSQLEIIDEEKGMAKLSKVKMPEVAQSQTTR